jgi:hypothetical protein
VNRRALGRGRLIVAIGATLVLVGSFPPWWTVGGTVTPTFSGNAFDGVGILAFLGAVAMLALVVLPYATREGDSRLDRPWSYVLLCAMAIAGVALRVMEIREFDGLGLPDRSPGLWTTGVALLVIVWGVAEILGERPTEY